VPILKEVVPPTRWLAVVIGFVGVIVATDMLSTGLRVSWPVWLALQAAVFWAISTVLLRKTSLAERTIVQMVLSNSILAAFTGVALVFHWTPVTPAQLALTSLTGIIAAVGQYAMFEGMRRAPVSILCAVRIYVARLGLPSRLCDLGRRAAAQRVPRRGPDLRRRRDHRAGRAVRPAGGAVTAVSSA
jgi:drug/metabolite transporter (DMT)-like permease